ncbi:DUF2333 family protein [Bowmanella dokdonensis]|uniref:DUF2333 family protein n=1 Tax=Bowmanella dokdonensis TaxID=751969 RepID=A0A939DR17_9ALTE|nr:DUF2333 family protein [Bowmanella dokdonensis]MBN7827419.1 DUF2333 family protein [Bowmanella dokdonensis]
MKQFLTTRWMLGGLAALLILGYALSLYWSSEPDMFDVSEYARQRANLNQTSVVTGYTVTATLIKVGNTLMDKPGGYLANDVMPPSVMMDDMPAWEFGVLEVVRDMALAMRNDFSRSQSQSLENPHLVKAQPLFNIDSRSWLLPSAESKYREGTLALERYLHELSDPSADNAQFYVRADNLRQWLQMVQKRMGSLSQRLSASVGQERLNTDLAGESKATQSTPGKGSQYMKTSWWKLDDVFYEARGCSWALLHLLKAVDADFANVLENKNARVSLQQIIRELESTQQTVWSPMILNGSGFGLVANHSLVMANYISRANAALIDLTELLSQG